MLPLRPAPTSMAICSLYGPLPPLRPSVPSMVLSSLYGPLFPLRPSVPSTAFILSMTLCFLNNHLSSLRPSVSSTALCPLYGPPKTVKKVKLPLLFREMFGKTHFVKVPRVVAIYFVLAMIVITAIITIITQAKY
jgi:hypothetical protein